jgi:hypothetical protein
MLNSALIRGKCEELNVLLQNEDKKREFGSEVEEVKREKLWGRSERHFSRRSNRIILLQGFQALPACFSERDKTRMKGR